MKAPARFAPAEMLILAARAAGRIDLHGARGATLCSTDEIEAMACLLATLGLVPLHPGAPVPDRLFFTSDKEC